MSKKKAQEVRQPYREDTSAGEDCFLNTIGISRGHGPVEEIRLAFTHEQGHYIKTLHLHHTQQLINDDENGVVIALKLNQNYELCQLILSLMPHVTVLEPLSLRDKVTEMLRWGLQRNGTTPTTTTPIPTEVGMAPPWKEGKGRV